MKTREEYERLSVEEQLEYLTEILKLENGKAGGIVKKKVGGMPFVALYLLGEPARIISDRTWRIPAPAHSRETPISEGDYVLGDLGIGINRKSRERELQLLNVKKMESSGELKKEVFDSLKEKWQREGFIFEETEIAEFDGKQTFGEWVSAEVACKLESRYEAFIQEKMRAQEEKLHALEARLQTEQEALDRLLADNEEAEKTHQRYERLGILPKEKALVDEKETYAYTTYGQLVQDVWGYLWKEKNLYYEQSTVRQFLNALRTRQLILLWGKPGTGKTSLPLAAAKALGAKCARVQVQSNWTDNQDLLGFYNIVEKRYVSTQFLDALVEAQENPSRLYLILLDEMNLSNVEYYFSEMLNAFTWDGDEVYTLHLYSRKLWQNAQEEQKEREDDSRLNAALKDMMLYKPDFPIPDNVRFVGTLNADATTKRISPKVIDRSAVIELEAISRETKRREEEALPETAALDGKNCWVGAGRFAVQKLPPQKDNPVKPILEEIRDLLREAGLPVSNRIDSYADQWLGGADSEAGLDEIILEKILPILNIENTEKNRSVLQRLGSEILEAHNCRQSLDKLEAMEEQAKDSHRIEYWEN